MVNKKLNKELIDLLDANINKSLDTTFYNKIKQLNNNGSNNNTNIISNKIEKPTQFKSFAKL